MKKIYAVVLVKLENDQEPIPHPVMVYCDHPATDVLAATAKYFHQSECKIPSLSLEVFPFGAKFLTEEEVQAFANASKSGHERMCIWTLFPDLQSSEMLTKACEYMDWFFEAELLVLSTYPIKDLYDKMNAAASDLEIAKKNLEELEKEYDNAYCAFADIAKDHKVADLYLLSEGQNTVRIGKDLVRVDLTEGRREVVHVERLRVNNLLQSVELEI